MNELSRAEAKYLAPPEGHNHYFECPAIKDENAICVCDQIDLADEEWAAELRADAEEWSGY